MQLIIFGGVFDFTLLTARTKARLHVAISWVGVNSYNLIICKVCLSSFLQLCSNVNWKSSHGQMLLENANLLMGH